MNKYELQERLKKFAIAIILFARKLPDDLENKIIKGQIIRSGTSPASNYRAACRAKSTADFIYKLKICEEELDETLFWLEVIQALLPELDADNKGPAKNKFIISGESFFRQTRREEGA